MTQVAEKPSMRTGPYESLHPRQGQGENERVIQVAIFESHLLIREALQRAMEGFPQVHVSAAPHRLQELLALLKQDAEIDVLVLGSTFGASECLEAIKAVQELRPSLALIVIQQALRPETALPLLKHGVQGLLGENAGTRDLIRAIAAVATGNTFLGQQARDILKHSTTHVPLHFTEREMQVLPLLRLGLSNFCIAQRLALKEKTVEKHLTHIYEKLHIHSRTEALLRIQTLHL